MVLKMLLKIVAFLIIYLIVQDNLLSAEDNIWRTFIKQPNEQYYELCSRQIYESLHCDYKENIYGEKLDTPTQQQLIQDSPLYGQFLELVESMNRFAVELAFQLYPLTDGGDQGDLFRSIGIIIKRDPEFFLHLVRKYCTSNGPLKRLVIMFPLEQVVDNMEARIQETEDRIKAFKQVNVTELLEGRDRCISILSKYLLDIKKSNEMPPETE